MARKERKEIRDNEGEIKELCWYCAQDMEKELVSHPFRAVDRKWNPTLKKYEKKYWTTVLCEECMSKKKNI